MEKSFQVSGVTALIITVVLVGGVIFLVTTGMNSDELKSILATPARDMTIGHIAGLVVLAGLLFGRS